jgi:hypothetical protein
MAPAVEVSHRGAKWDDRIAPQIRFDNGAAYDSLPGEVEPSLPAVRFLELACARGPPRQDGDGLA